MLLAIIESHQINTLRRCEICPTFYHKKTQFVLLSKVSVWNQPHFRVNKPAKRKTNEYINIRRSVPQRRQGGSGLFTVCFSHVTPVCWYKNATDFKSKPRIGAEVDLERCKVFSAFICVPKKKQLTSNHTFIFANQKVNRANSVITNQSKTLCISLNIYPMAEANPGSISLLFDS